MIIEEEKSRDFRCCVDRSRMCVGKKCMAWQWIRVHIPGKGDKKWFIRKEAPQPSYREIKPIYGRCGRAYDN